MKTVSVLITYHNEKELLTQCIDSVLSQKNPPEEIVVFDDASTFPATDYIPAHPRVRVLRSEKNLGPSRGRNALLKDAKGDYIHFHDADDRFTSQWVERIREAMEKDRDAIYSEVNSYWPEGKIAGNQVVGLYPFSESNDLIRFCIRHYMLVPAGTFKRSLVQKIQGYRESLWQSEDFDFNVRIALEKPRFEILTESLVEIRLRKESRSQDRAETNTFALQALLLLEKDVPQEFKRDLAEKASEIGAVLFRLGEKEKAREAFEVAKHWGPAAYERENRVYRWIAGILGQEQAERIGFLYRSMKKKPGKRLPVEV